MTYFDPPYGTMNKNMSSSTRYSTFYHLWNTLATNCKPKNLSGKAQKPSSLNGMTDDSEKNKKGIVIPYFTDLIRECTSKYVSFSYSNHGLLSVNDFKHITEYLNMKLDIYEHTDHKVNTQTKTAKKNGQYINNLERLTEQNSSKFNKAKTDIEKVKIFKDMLDEPIKLIEYLFVFTKDSDFEVNFIRLSKIKIPSLKIKCVR